MLGWEAVAEGPGQILESHPELAHLPLWFSDPLPSVQVMGWLASEELTTGAREPPGPWEAAPSA